MQERLSRCCLSRCCLSDGCCQMLSVRCKGSCPGPVRAFQRARSDRMRVMSSLHTTDNFRQDRRCPND